MEARKLSAEPSESFRLALRVRHPSMDPADISRALGIVPEHAFKAGDPRPSRHELTEAAVHSQSYWLGVLDTAGRGPDFLFPEDRRSQIFQRQLAKARGTLSWALSLGCARLFKMHERFLRRVRSEGGDIALLVTIFSTEIGSFTLPSETSRFLGELGIVLEFELARE